MPLTEIEAPTTLGIGTRVRCERQAPPSGTWRRYAGKVGTVVRINEDAGEIGVNLSPSGRSHDSPITWFIPSELTLLS